MAVRLKVKEIAKQKGFSMGKLSRTADVSYRTIKLIYDNPYRDVSTYTLNKLAQALGVDVSKLIESVPDEL
ncbi:MAG: helix-turn-helix domain-containing protein [Ktedonobacteraceae bacterium]